MDNTIIYLTDNILAEPLASRVREILTEKACGIPIISISQEPLDYGTNICVGKIGRSWLSLYKQLQEGLEAATAKNIVIAEHDCCYSEEHLNWTPPRDDTFYYNHNHWLVQWGGNHPELNGMYSYWPRRYALSQLVCNRELLLRSTTERLSFIEKGFLITKGLKGAGEPGVNDAEAIETPLQAAARRAASGRAITSPTLAGYLTHYNAEPFKTVNPTLDIRHSTNFTGPKRGKNRCYELPYWGKFDELMQETARV